MTDLDPLGWGLGPGVAVRLLRSNRALPDVLTPDEQARCDAFGSDDRRRQFALGRTAARTLAAARLGGPPDAVALAVAADGAPEVPGAHLSIAHTGRGEAAAAAAALAAVPVGVDLEAVRPRRPDLWRRILRDDEQSVLASLGGPSDDTQTLLWTLKEAVLKAQRTGFRAGGRSVRLTLNADGSPPDRGRASAHAEASGDWSLAFGREGDLWVAVAWSVG